MPALLRRQIRERAILALFRLQLLVQRREELRVEAGSHFAGEEQPFLLVVTDQQRAEMFSRALRWREATNDELLLAHAFEFDPRATPSARFVSRPALFADHSLQPQSLDFPQERVRIPSDLTGEPDAAARILAKRREQLLPPLHRQADHALPRCLKKIKHVVIDR